MSEELDKESNVNGDASDAQRDTDQDAAELANAEPRHRVWLVSSLVVALVAVGGAGAYWLLPILTQGAENPLEGSSEGALSDSAAQSDVPSESASAMPMRKSWQEDAALVGRLNEIEARLRRIEAAPQALARANVWLQAAQNNLTTPGGARFALVAARVAATLLEQTNAPRARLALSELRDLIAQLETLDASAQQAFDAIHAALVWMDDGLQADMPKAQADAPPPSADSAEESFWDKGANRVGDLLAEVFQVQRDEEVLSAAWQVVVVRRALVLAQAALLDRDKAAWHIAMRHALSAARQLPSSELIEKVKSAQAIEVTFADERMRARLTEIMSALRTSERNAGRDAK